MRRLGTLLLLLAAVGCSSSGTTTTASTPPVTHAPAAPGGLIGVIDSARVAAVCTNAQAAQTVQSAGGSTLTDPLAAAAGLLERPPVDPTASAAAVAIRRDLAAGHPNLALNQALAFCHSHGG